MTFFLDIILKSFTQLDIYLRNVNFSSVASLTLTTFQNTPVFCPLNVLILYASGRVSAYEDMIFVNAMLPLFKTSLPDRQHIYLLPMNPQFICSYVFVPLAFIMGVEWADCRVVAELIGLKTFLNEFYAYGVMAEYIRNRDTGTGPSLSVSHAAYAVH